MRPLPNFAMCELRIVSPHRFHRGGAITAARALNGPGGPATSSLSLPAASPPSPGLVHPRGEDVAWHTRRRISSRKVRRGVSNVITLDSCLLCSSTTKSYSALTSKAKLPSGVPGCALSFPRTSPRPFFPPFSFFSRCNDVRTKDVNKSRRKRGRDGGRRRTGNGRGEGARQR